MLCPDHRGDLLVHDDRTLPDTALSAASWAEISRALPNLHMVDCAAMMDEVRWVKTSGEIALLKRGADLLDDAYLEVFPTIRTGETERDVHSRMISSCLRRGANWAHGILNSSTNLVHRMLSEHPSLGDARGAGLMCAFELVKNKDTKEPWTKDSPFSVRLGQLLHERGVLVRILAQLVLAPPLTITREQIDELLSILDGALTDVEREFGMRQP
jgi:Aminotransferase class-III